MKTVTIIPAEEKFLLSYWETFGQIAGEGKYLSVCRRLPLSATAAFVEQSIRCGYPFYFVMDGGDILPKDEKTGSLGMGLRKPYRGQGIGRRLILTVLKEAKEFGLSAIELEVRASNKRAVGLYRSVGFRFVKRITDGVRAGNSMEDVLHMRLNFEGLLE